MPEGFLDNEGRLVLPEELVEELGWRPGDRVVCHLDGSELVIHAATPASSLKEEARRLALSMRDLASEAVKHVADTVSSVKPAPSPPVAPAEGSAKGSAEGPPSAAASGVPFHGVLPQVPNSVYVAPNVTLIGDVKLGEECSVWPGAVLRGDVAPVRVGRRTNIQEGAVLHVSPQVPCSVGTGVTIGHHAAVHACTVGDYSLIGIHAVVLDGARVGSQCIVAAGAVVPPGAEIPSGKMVMGVPGRVVRDLTPEEIERVHSSADRYVSLKNEYLRPTAVAARSQPAPARPDPPAPGTLPRYDCRRAAGPIRIDGALDDPGWAGVAPMAPLTHSNGSGLPLQATEVRACWDDGRLYLAFACKDTEIWGSFENRDDPLYDEEVVEFFLCASGDVREYYEFEISPLNTVFDARVHNPTGDRASMTVDRAWNAAGLETAVRVSGIVNDRTSPDIGWIVEAALPFADLGLAGPPEPGAVWRVNFYRIERGPVTEFTAWSPTYREPADFHVPACFGELVFTR